MIVLIIKFVVKFFLVSDNIPKSLNLFLKNWRIGIEITDDDIEASYYIYEVFILLFVVIHMISLIFQGLWYNREIDIETIDEAAERIGIQNKSKFLIKIFKNIFSMI